MQCCGVYHKYANSVKNIDFCVYYTEHVQRSKGFFWAEGLIESLKILLV